MKDLLISIVNGKAHDLVLDCVRSIIEKTAEISYDIVVIDNATGYKKLGVLNEMGVEIIKNDKPQGFSENHNMIVSRLDSYRYLAIFNDDAMLRNNAFKIMLSILDKDSAYALSGCKVIGPDNRLQPHAAPFLNIRYFIDNLLGYPLGSIDGYSKFFRNYIDFDRTQDVDWVSGCCMVVRSDYIKRFGFLDSAYFMYVEDCDFCFRVMRNGYKRLYIAEAEISHLGGASTKGNAAVHAKIFIKSQQSRLRYLRKYARFQYVIFLVFVNVIIFLKIAKKMLFNRDFIWCLEALNTMRFRPIV